MINKRGLTPEEFEQVDEELFKHLMIYDTFIEPSGARFEMLKHAHLCQTITLNNSNMTKDVAKSIKTIDYDFLGILDGGTTKERMEAREKQKTSETQSYLASKMQKLKDKKNGK